MLDFFFLHGFRTVRYAALSQQKNSRSRKVKRFILNGSVSILNGSIPILNSYVPILNGSIPILSGYAPIQNGSVPLLNGFPHNYWTSPITKRFVVMLNGY